MEPGPGQVSTSDGALVTVKVDAQVRGCVHESLAVKITVIDPPHLPGAVGVVGVYVIPVLLLPVTVAEASQVENAASIDAWVMHGSSV